jgi:hypothetical protein
MSDRNYCRDELSEDAGHTGAASLRRHCERPKGHEGDHESSPFSWDEFGWAMTLDRDTTAYRTGWKT